MSNRPEKHSLRRRRGIRFRLLVSVNVVALAALALLLFLDYQREVKHRLTVMQGALEEEAKTLLPALRHMAADGEAAVQNHMDLVCGRMRDSSSPGHHIALIWGDMTLQATAHHRASPEMLLTMRRAIESGETGKSRLIVGSDADDEMTVFVSEQTSNVVRDARERAFQRAAVLGTLLAIAAFVVNLILIRLVVKPVRELAATVRRIGTGEFHATAPGSRTAEFATLSAEVNAMAATLEGNEKLRRLEMDRAREIQERLSTIPDSVPGMAVVTRYDPADAVAGDYYDLLPLSDGTWLLCIADVMGHGVPAAMGAAILKTLLVEACQQLRGPEEVLKFVNERYCRVSLDCDFASVMLVRWDAAQNEITYASAGHEHGILIAADGDTQLLEATGMVIGLHETATWTTKSISMPAGARLLLTTDGVTETRSPSGELFGADRLEAALRDRSAATLAEKLDHIVQAVTKHRVDGAQSDDVTLVLAEFGTA